MRYSRIKGEGLSYFHCISRVVDRRFIFNDAEKEHFVSLMRKLEAFHGMRVVTYCVMSNHFHLLIEEPDRETLPPLDRETLLKRMGFLYKAHTIRTVREELNRAAQSGNTQWEQEILDRYRRRMGDLSAFMKDLKQRFSQWYNRREGRRGTLWEDRFKSLLVEGDTKALMTVAAYIDLNPIRAGIVEKVESYRWCGYASAVAGNRWAREGLRRIWGQSPAISAGEDELDWDTVSPQYRLWLYQEGVEKKQAETGKKARRKGFTEEELEETIASGGQLPLPSVLRKRVRYFSDGAVLGSADFVNRIFAHQREKHGLKRKTGARRMKDAAWEGLHVMRDLTVDRIG
ncbi:MAG: transposase [Verrucomicrobiales bacterium]|nr:transposase [Verrucomicrobiales bacterium]